LVHLKGTGDLNQNNFGRAKKLKIVFKKQDRALFLLTDGRQHINEKPIKAAFRAAFLLKMA
jgi:hypothetical protein